MTIVQEYLDLTKKWKQEYGEKTLVLMQVGSFFESYGLLDNNNNIYGSNITDFANINDMAISKKNLCVGKEKVVMAGFGLPQIEKYVKKMQNYGYTIVVYTQDTQSKNTTRSLNTIFSPGTYFSNDNKELSNNIMCIWLHYSNNNIIRSQEITVGLTNIDIYTGKISIFEYSKEYIHNPTTYDDLERYISVYNPVECIIISNLETGIVDDIINFISLNSNKIHRLNENDKNEMSKNIKNAEKQIYQEQTVKHFYQKNEETILNSLQNYCIAIQSFVFLLDFVYKHNPNLVNNISEPFFENYTDKLVLANHSLKQLNIIPDNRYTGKYSCVSNLLNNCITPMGKRQFQYNLLNPITNIKSLNESYDITDYMLKDTKLWNDFRTVLNDIRDIEKLRRKIIMQKVTPKDFTNLHKNLEIIQSLYKKCSKDKTITKYLNISLGDIKNINILCLNLIKIIEETLDLKISKNIDDISQDKLGNYDTTNIFFINRGLYQDLDSSYKKTLDSKEQLECIRKYFSDVLINYEKSCKLNSDYVKIHETAKTDAILLTTKRRSTLIKKHLESLGDEIEIKYKSEYSKEDEVYLLSLKNIDFSNYGGSATNIIITSPQIRQITNFINSSKTELISKLEIYYYKFINKFIENNIDNIVKFVTLLDILQCKCFIANEYNYCKPIIKKYNRSFVDFKGIRHCLIEHLNTREIYITNDLSLGLEKNNCDGILLYGTNAVGKTSIIKAIGISIIMAQAGLFVPASEFSYFPYNTIFTRILGNDNIFKGLSTFAVEMSELRTILKLADKNSIILGDELCSGTESESALSIFVSGLEILHKINCTFLFATHFQQILEFDEIKNLDRMKIYHMSVVFNKEMNKLIYNRKLQEGAGLTLYGLEVAKSLDLPDVLINRAYELRNKYTDYINYILDSKVSSYNSKKIKEKLCEICTKNPSCDIHHLQYQSKAKKNGIINKEFHKNNIANLISICKVCHDNIHKNNIEYKRVKTSNGYELQEI